MENRDILISIILISIIVSIIYLAMFPTSSISETYMDITGEETVFDDWDKDTADDFDSYWSSLRSIPAGFRDSIDNVITNIFDQDLNTTDDVTFNDVSTGNVTVSGDFIGGNVANWDTAYVERGSQIAGNNLTWSGGQLHASGVGGSNDAVYACLSDSTDQTFAATGTGYNITFNTNDEINGITHSTVSEPQNITIVTAGVYTIIAQPQVHANAGAAGNFHMWLRKDSGGGFDDVANTNVELTLVSNEEDVIPLIVTIALDVGDIIRVNASVSHTGIELDAQTPANEPAIPSIIFSMYRIGA